METFYIFFYSRYKLISKFSPSSCCRNTIQNLSDPQPLLPGDRCIYTGIFTGLPALEYITEPSSTAATSPSATPTFASLCIKPETCFVETCALQLDVCVDRAFCYPNKKVETVRMCVGQSTCLVRRGKTHEVVKKPLCSTGQFYNANANKCIPLPAGEYNTVSMSSS